jgi:hypothetical protein
MRRVPRTRIVPQMSAPRVDGDVQLRTAGRMRPRHALLAALTCALGAGGWTSGPAAAKAVAPASTARVTPAGAARAIALERPLAVSSDALPVNDKPLAELTASDTEGELG